MADIVRRLERWRVKTDPDKVCERLKELRPSMERRQEMQQLLLVEIETKAKQVLDSANIPTMLYPFYLNFAREIYSRRLRFSGPSLAREIGILLEKWVMRTLDREVLKRIRDEALSVPEPAP
ncbi:MAG: hypothetical protein ABIK39_01575 [candidate division WOR-3 bacterium]